MASVLSSLFSSGSLTTGVLGLSVLLGSHSSAASQAATPIALIKAGTNVAGNASILAQMFATSNPAARDTALAIAANPAEAPQLIGTLEQEVATQSNGILSSLAQAVHLNNMLGTA
jgi:hypothetical protein